jgi:hypothetical protein
MADPGWEGVTMRTLGQLLTVSLGLVLVASGVAKALWEAPGWPIASAVLPRQVVSVGTTLLPWVEIGIGLSLISGYLHPATAIAGLILLLAFTALLVVGLRSELEAPCNCLGRLTPLPADEGAVVRNLVLLSYAVASTCSPSPSSLWAHSESGSPSAGPLLPMLVALVALGFGFGPFILGGVVSLWRDAARIVDPSIAGTRPEGSSP